MISQLGFKPTMCEKLSFHTDSVHLTFDVVIRPLVFDLILMTDRMQTWSWSLGQQKKPHLDAPKSLTNNFHAHNMPLRHIVCVLLRELLQLFSGNHQAEAAIIHLNEDLSL